MAEISQILEASEAAAADRNSDSLPDNFDPITMRKTKPGLKRLLLTISVLFSFICGIPFFLKSVEIYRSPIPFADMDSLSNSIESNSVLFPCRFHVVFIDFDHSEVSADKLGFLVLGHMQKFTSNDSVCGTCGNNYNVSVTLESGGDCTQSENVESSGLWQCGKVKDVKLNDMLKNDESFDEYLDSVLGGSGNSEKVYTVVVVNRDDKIRTVIGKNRHAWIVGRVSEVGATVEMVAEILVKVFVNGGIEKGSIHGEFMPVGADGRIVLSFNMLNADPRDWIYDWKFEEIDEILLAPISKILAPLANISIESQVLYHTPKSSFSYWDEEEDSYVFSMGDLPFFVNSNEWHLDTSIAAGGRSKILQFVVYVPSVKECPLLLQLPNGEISMTNGFISPMWGGIIVWNPPGCVRDSESLHPVRNRISPQDLKKIFEVFVGQLRQIFGLNSGSLYHGASSTFILLSSGEGFTEWELDFLSRQHTCYNLLQCGTTLGSLSRLVQSLPRMIIKDEIGKQVKFSLEAAKLARSNASRGIFDASAVSSREARTLAEDAFFHPSMMSVSYYSFEHCFAVYSRLMPMVIPLGYNAIKRAVVEVQVSPEARTLPFFLPVSMHIILAVLRELKRYKQESAKFRAWRKIASEPS